MAWGVSPSIKEKRGKIKSRSDVLVSERDAIEAGPHLRMSCCRKDILELYAS